MCQLKGQLAEREAGHVPPETLRIAFATPEYVTEKYFDGGLANYVHRVAVALAGIGHDIHVLTLSEIDDSEFEHEGVTVHRILNSKGWSHLDRLTRHHLPATVQLLDLSVKVYRKLKCLNTQQPFHLVQFPSYSCCGLVSICCLRVPHALRASSYRPALNNADRVKRTLDSLIVKRLESLQFRLSRYVYTPSHALQQMLTKEARLADVRVIRPTFYLESQDWDNSVYDRLKGKKYLLFFGRFQLHKGFHTLAQALPRVMEQYPGRLCGSGRARHEIHSRSVHGRLCARAVWRLCRATRAAGKTAAPSALSGDRRRTPGSSTFFDRELIKCRHGSDGSREGGDWDNRHEF